MSFELSFFLFSFSFLSFLTQISGIRLFIKTYTACHVYTVTPFASTLPARVNSRPKKIDFFVPSNITSHYTCYCSILKAIFILAEERSATFSRHSKLCNHPSYLKNGSSVFHTISILSSPLIITFLITFWIFSLSKDSILMIFSNCVSNLPAELSSVGSSDLSCSIF